MRETDNPDTFKLTKDLIEKWLGNEEEEFRLDTIRKKYNISAESDLFYKTISRMVESGQLQRLRRGWYRKVKQIAPIQWWTGEKTDRIPLKWPYGIEDESSFGFDDTIEVFPGDSIVIAGTSNQGKTTMALNLLLNNLDLFPNSRLMVNEYKPQRFRDRMEQFTWANYWNEDKPRFETLPVIENHIDYILKDAHNLIDWLYIGENFWEVADRIQRMQMKLGERGLLTVVLQKTTIKEWGVGAEWGTFFPAVYFTIDPPGRLHVWKVKSAPKGIMKPEGKDYAFDIIERGSQFFNIREVEMCPSCKGRRFIYGDKCKRCYGKGFVEKQGAE